MSQYRASESWELKLERADEHLQTLDETIKEWMRTKPYEVVDEFDAEKQLNVVRVQHIENPPVDLGLVVGDAVQNLRNALDNLALALSVQNAGGYVMPKVEEDSAFPITTTPDGWKGAVGRGRLGCMSSRAAAIVRAAQPYRRRQDPFSHPLWTLHELSNIDKHRRIPVIAFYVTPTGLAIGGTGYVGYLSYAPSGPYEEGAILAEYRDITGPQMNVQMSFAPHVALAQGTPGSGAPLLDVLQTIRGYIETRIANRARPLP